MDWSGLPKWQTDPKQSKLACVCPTVLQFPNNPTQVHQGMWTRCSVQGGDLEAIGVSPDKIWWIPLWSTVQVLVTMDQKSLQPMGGSSKPGAAEQKVLTRYMDNKEREKSIAEYHLLKLKIEEHKREVFFYKNPYNRKDTLHTPYNGLSVGEEGNGRGK